MRKTLFFLFSFQIFFEFWAKNFQTFGQKTSRSFQNYLLRVQRNSLWLEILQHGSQNSIYVSRVKISEETVFLFFFSEFFRILSETFFQTFGEKSSKKLSELPSGCPKEQLVAWIFLFKFWIVSDFLQKPLAWFSKFYLRVQSKNCGKNSFLRFSFQKFFRNLSENFFWLLAKKLQEVFKTIFYVSRGTVCGLKFFSMVPKILSTCPG